MDTAFRLFLRLVSLPEKITFNTGWRVLVVILGICVLYLLTLQKDEEGRVQDYLERVWQRMSAMREKALSRHLAIINMSAKAMTSAADNLFGPSLFSLRAIGVSVALSFFSLNLYYFMNERDWDNWVDVWIFLGLALLPFFVTGTAASDQNVRYHRRKHNPQWLLVWAFFLVVLILRQYVFPLACTSCIPKQYQSFWVGAMSMMLGIAVVAAVLFSAFVLITRFSLKKLSNSDSTIKSIGFLLLGCVPIPVFWILLKVVILVITRTEFTSKGPSDPNATPHITAQEWLTISPLVIYALSFFVNLAFLLLPILFFSMATLLLIHRLLWPILERPIRKFHKIGLSDYPKVIVTVGVLLILLGIGKVEWLEKAFQVVGIG